MVGVCILHISQQSHVDQSCGIKALKKGPVPHLEESFIQILPPTCTAVNHFLQPRKKKKKSVRPLRFNCQDLDLDKGFVFTVHIVGTATIVIINWWLTGPIQPTESSNPGLWFIFQYTHAQVIYSGDKVKIFH